MMIEIVIALINEFCLSLRLARYPNDRLGSGIVETEINKIVIIA